jgi:hypothetical protein
MIKILIFIITNDSEIEHNSIKHISKHLKPNKANMINIFAIKKQYFLIRYLINNLINSLPSKYLS